MPPLHLGNATVRVEDLLPLQRLCEERQGAVWLC